MEPDIERYRAYDVIEAELNFLVPSDKTPIYYASEAGADAALSMTGQFQEKTVSIRNGRRAGTVFSLDGEGFCLVDHPTAVSDFTDKGDVCSVYEPEVISLIKSETGARRVVIFDHTLRSDSADVRAAAQSREPSKVVHNDYTDHSAPIRVHDILGDEAATLLKNRFAIINVWRAMRGPVLTSPLALCDAKSLSSDNLVPSERRARDRIGELTLVTHNPAQRWYCFPAMIRDEALLIKTFDSALDGRARASIHTAFTDPMSPVGAAPRESIETRCFAFFGD